MYESSPELVDRDVLSAIESLIRAYERERRNRDGVTVTPSGRARAVYEQCRRMCEWRLGRQSLNKGESDSDSDHPLPGELSGPELMLCLKRLRKSMRVWHKKGGRQGYLIYVRGFIADANSML